MCITFFATFMSCIFGIILLGLKLSEFFDISKASISHTELVNCVKKSHLPINENLTFMKISIHASLVLVQGTPFFFFQFAVFWGRKSDQKTRES